MYRIEATVTTATPRELKITANCPLVWLQSAGSTYALGSTEIEGKLSPGETLEPLSEPVQEVELPFNPSFHPDLKVGDRLILRCYFGGESRL